MGLLQRETYSSHGGKTVTLLLRGIVVVVVVSSPPQARMCCSSMTPDSAVHSCGDTLRCKLRHHLLQNNGGKERSHPQSLWRTSSELFFCFFVIFCSTPEKAPLENTESLKENFDFKMYIIFFLQRTIANQSPQWVTMGKP